MKNNLFKRVFGITVSVLSFCILTSVNANECAGDVCASTMGEHNANVTVGEVDTPVYDVEITWDSLKYNWKYNNSTHKHEWIVEEKSDCYRYFLDSSSRDNWENIELYTDSTCETKVVDDITFDEVYNEMKNDVKAYYFLGEPRKQNSINISDFSENARIGANMKWNSVQDYNWTNAEFVVPGYFTRVCNEITNSETFEMHKSDLYINDTCNTRLTVQDEYSPSFDDGNTYYYVSWEEQEAVVGNGEIELGYPNTAVGDVAWPDSTPEHYIKEYYERWNRFNYSYHVLLNLKVDSSKEVITPTAGESIGTVTITLKEIK